MKLIYSAKAIYKLQFRKKYHKTGGAQENILQHWCQDSVSPVKLTLSPSINFHRKMFRWYALEALLCRQFSIPFWNEPYESQIFKAAKKHAAIDRLVRTKHGNMIWEVSVQKYEEEFRKLALLNYKVLVWIKETTA